VAPRSEWWPIMQSMPTEYSVGRGARHLFTDGCGGVAYCHTCHAQEDRFRKKCCNSSLVTLTFDLKFELGRDFCTMHLIAKFHHRTFNRSCWQTNKLIKQTDAAENINLARLCHAGAWVKILWIYLCDKNTINNNNWSLWSLCYLFPHASKVDDGGNQQDEQYDPEERDEKHFPSPEKV